MEVPGLGVELELRPTYTTAQGTTAHGTTAQSNARSLTRWVRPGNWTCILMDAGQIRFFWATTGTPFLIYFFHGDSQGILVSQPSCGREWGRAGVIFRPGPSATGLDQGSGRILQHPLPALSFLLFSAGIMPSTYGSGTLFFCLFFFFRHIVLEGLSLDNSSGFTLASSGISPAGCTWCHLEMLPGERARMLDQRQSNQKTEPVWVQRRLWKKDWTEEKGEDQDEEDQRDLQLRFVFVLFCFWQNKAFITETPSNHTGKDVHKGGCNRDQPWSRGAPTSGRPTPWSWGF